jgi:hypothetical protein
MKIVVLILTCLAATPEENCSKATALEWREVMATPGECGMAGMSTAASDPRGNEGLRTKIVCGRPMSKEHAANSGRGN